MTIILNGATIQLNKTKRSIIIRDKRGCFVGLYSLDKAIEDLVKARQTGDLKILLCEVEQPLNKPKTEQSELDFSVRLQP